MRTLFVDASFWIALINPRDSLHRRAAAFKADLAGVVMTTTEEVLTELLNYFSGHPVLRQTAMGAVRNLIDDPQVTVVPQSHDSFTGGFALYAAREDKGYSLTDCISMQLMRQQAIVDALTSDAHFEQEGFRAILRA